MNDIQRDEYIALLQDEPSVAEGKETRDDVGVSPSQSLWTTRLRRWAMAVVVVCTIVDVALFACMSLEAFSKRNMRSKIGDDLELRNPYINMDALYEQPNFISMKHHPVLNNARAFYQVSSTEPATVIPPYEDVQLMYSGFIPVFTRRLLLTPTTSTIAQFRMMDFGMENCTFAITVPPQNQTTDIISGFENTTPLIHIWQLPLSMKLNPKTLSWSTRPQPRTHFANLPVSYGVTQQTPGFECKSMEYYTFEFTCSSPNCHIDIIGVGKKRSGLYILQHQTK